MKNIGLLFLISFLFFVFGQILWSIGLLAEDPLFGSKLAEDWTINIIFTLCSIFGLIASIKLYRIK